MSTSRRLGHLKKSEAEGVKFVCAEFRLDQVPNDGDQRYEDWAIVCLLNRIQAQ